MTAKDWIDEEDTAPPRRSFFRDKKRDDRDFDQTALREGGNQEQTLHRDYSAHFFRWSFAKRLIKRTDAVLEVGCGPDRPLWKLLFHSLQPDAAKYVGIDLNKLPPTKHQHTLFLGEFNFVKDYKKVPKLVAERFPEATWPVAGGAQPGLSFDVAVNFEVIEHMLPAHGATMLKGIHHCLRPGGTLLLSTPCYDGRRHAANHIHEYTVMELQLAIEKAGFKVERRFGTFMDTKHLKRVNQVIGGTRGAELVGVVRDLSEYYSNDALSCIFAPLFPDISRNNLWVCSKQ